MIVSGWDDVDDDAMASPRLPKHVSASEAPHLKLLPRVEVFLRVAMKLRGLRFMASGHCQSRLQKSFKLAQGSQPRPIMLRLSSLAENALEIFGHRIIAAGLHETNIRPQLMSRLRHRPSQTAVANGEHREIWGPHGARNSDTCSAQGHGSCVVRGN